MDPTLVILAAGLASRFGRSKQTQSVGPSGETIMDYSIFDAARAGFGEVLLVIHPALPAEYRERMVRLWGDRIPIRFVVQPADGATRSGILYSRSKPWGTGHALLASLAKTHGSLAAINADDFYGHGSFQQLMAFLSSEGTDAEFDACMVGFRLDLTLSESGGVSRGVSRRAGGRLLAVEELREICRHGGALSGTNDAGEPVRLEGSQLVSMNMWGFRTNPADAMGALFDRFIQAHGHDASREFYLPGAINHLIADRGWKVSVIPSTERWLGLTHPEDLTSVQSAIAERVRQGDYPDDLFAGAAR